MPQLPSYVQRLAAAMVSGDWNQQAILERSRAAARSRGRWLTRLVQQVCEAWLDRPPLQSKLATFIAEGDYVTWQQGDRIVPAIVFSPSMHPGSFTCIRPLPNISTWMRLAEWLNISPGELDWFADIQGRQRHIPTGRLQHYRYNWVRKRHGSARLIEAAKPRLKEIQRRLLHEILELIPPHAAAHGFRAAHSVRSFVEPHAGRPIVLRIDLRDFFPSIPAAQVLALFMAVGYPETVARVLTGLCTNRVPSSILEEVPEGVSAEEFRRLSGLYGRRHLPQGAPTSPALANLCAFALDCRLSGLARAAGGTYTRYADDLLFSGDEDFARSARRFHVHAAAIAMDENFSVHFRKTRIMRPGVRQHAAGLTLNVRPNIPRAEFDRLKAVLHHCLNGGPQAQNRGGHGDFRAHLAGKIGYVAMIHPARGAKLRSIFDRILWPDSSVRSNG